MAALSEQSHPPTSSHVDASWLHFSLASAYGGYATGCEPWRVVEPKGNPTSSMWLTHNRSGACDGSNSNAGGPHLTFKLQSKCLLSYIEIHNGGTSEIDVHVGMKDGLQ